MRFSKILLLGLLISSSVQAQNLNISLFDDDVDVQPNLGTNAKPLSTIHITPPPLPDITIDLDNSTPQTQPQPEQPTQEVSIPPSEVINLPTTTTGEVHNTPSGAPPSASIPLHDVSDFDIQGFYLGMTLNEVLENAERAGFVLKSSREDLPRFYAKDYEHQCRQRGVIIPDKVRECIRHMARSEQQAYIAQIDMTRGKNEEISFMFTSHLTSNEVYKIIYYNYGDNSLNFTTVNRAKKLQRQKEFWTAIYETYGHPDDARKMIWGNPRRAYMQVKMFGTAYNAMITLTDMLLYAQDYYQADDIEQDRPPKNNFVFSP